MNEMLKDGYLVMGTDTQEAITKINDFKAHTKVDTVDTNKIALMNVVDGPSGKMLAVLKPGKVYKVNKTSCSVKCMKYDRESLLADGWDEETLYQAENSGMFAKIGKKIYPISAIAYTSLAMRAGITGPASTQRSLAKDMLIAENFDSDDKVKLVKRFDGDREKIFAVMSEDYSYIRQDIISNIIGKCDIDYYGLGLPSDCNWEINQTETRAYINFAEKTENHKRVDSTGTVYEEVNYEPGIMMETSDTGDSAFRIASYMDIRDSKGRANRIFTEDKYEKVHMGTLNISDIHKYAEESIFPKLTIYPKLYNKLDNIEFYDDGEFDEIKAAQATEELIKVLVYCKLNTVLGKKRMRKAEELFSTKLYNGDYKRLTAFDLMVFVLDLTKTEFCADNDNVKKNIAEYTHRILSYPFHKISIVETEEKEAV